MDKLLQDLKFAIRVLRKQPAFTIITLLTLTIGIGANAAIFSVVNAILIRPLPMKSPEKVVVISSTVKREIVERRALCYPDFLDIRQQNSVFEKIAAYSDDSFTFSNKGIAERVEGEQVSPDYFDILSVTPEWGRTFSEQEDQLSNPARVAVISHSFWETRFNSDRSITGKIIKLNHQDFVVIGILPENFRGLDDDTDIWLTMSSLALMGNERFLKNRGTRWHNAVARLKPAVSLQQAQAEIETIAKRLEKDYPDTNANYGSLLIPLREETFGDVESPALILLAAVFFVLLIGCANVANLMLSRTASRQREIAIRTALGAGKAHILRQMVTESLLLSAAGCACGLILSVWLMDLLRTFSPLNLPSFANLELDTTVLGYAILISLFTGLFMSIIPALQAAGHSPQDALKEGALQSLGSLQGRKSRAFFIVFEVALALLLLTGAGLMIRTLFNMESISLGLNGDRLLVMRISIPDAYSDEKTTQSSMQILEKVKSLPGVQSAAFTSDIPLEGSSSASIVTVEGDTKRTRVYTHRISSELFSTTNIPIMRGRSFGADDVKDKPLVVIVSEKMAKRSWPQQDPIGKRLKFGRHESENPWITVVGVAKDVKHRALIDDPLAAPDDPDLYLALAQGTRKDLGLVIRTANDDVSIAEAIRREIQRTDRDIPVYAITTMKELAGRQTSASRFSAVLMTGFGVVALLLASIGIYGVLSYLVTQRTREIGLRLALGAKKEQVFRLVLKQALKWVVAGLLFGLGSAAVLNRLLTSQLYQISPNDPATYITITLILLTVAFLAVMIPARRAMKIDPWIALRYE